MQTAVMRDPGTGGCNRERESEKEMGGARESFRHGIEKDYDESGWGEKCGGSINGGTGDQKSSRADHEKGPRRRFSHEPVSIRGARIFLIQRPIAPTDEKH